MTRRPGGIVVYAREGYAARLAHCHLAIFMQASRHAAAMGCLLLLAACGRATGDAGTAGAAGALPQHFEITVDGTSHTLSPDDPRVSVVIATVSGSGTGLSLSALDKSRNLNFTILVNEPSIRPGDFLVGKCRGAEKCRTRSHTAVLAPYPDGKAPDPLAGKMAYDDPELGLQPAVLTLTQVDDVLWPGVGPAKRIRGSFRGALASIQHRGPDDKDHLNWPPETRRRAIRPVCGGEVAALAHPNASLGKTTRYGKFLAAAARKVPRRTAAISLAEGMGLYAPATTNIPVRPAGRHWAADGPTHARRNMFIDQPKAGAGGAAEKAA